MTEQQYAQLSIALQKMKALVKQENEDGDQETAHIEADEILLDLLEDFGASEIVEEFKKLPKWYS